LLVFSFLFAVKNKNMEKRTLGNSDLEITPIGFGAWAIGGGDWVFAWGAQDDNESVAAIEHAVASGINWIDTAAVYGLGHSEEVVARALKNIGPARRPYVFTKCSLVWNAQGEVSHSLKSASIRREVEDSLRRLNGETIDLYQIHWATWAPDGAPDIEEGWQTLKELKTEGKVREIGVSNFNAAELERIRKIAPVTSLQPPYSMLRRGIEAEVLPYAKANNIGVIVYSPMQSGLLTGKMTRERIAHMPADDWRRGNQEFQEPNLTKNLELADLLGEIGARHGVSAGVVAIAWTLRSDAVTGAIVGARNPQQIDGIIGAGEFRLSDAEAAEIEAKL
jgi:aryl-alcohol dehydrogenase-like predicted oxidoreductase